jgi:hypothetical protein
MRTRGSLARAFQASLGTVGEGFYAIGRGMSDISLMPRHTSPALMQREVDRRLEEQAERIVTEIERRAYGG